MQINRINQFILPQKSQPAFNGIWFDEVDDAIISSSFRDDELFDPKRDFVDNEYRMYDHNQMDLTPPKQAFPVPKLFMDVYDMKDSRKPEVESDAYFNDYSLIEVLKDSEYKDCSNGLSINDELTLKNLSYLRSYEGNLVYDSHMNIDLQDFAMKYPSIKQKNAMAVANACKLKDYGEDEYFSQAVFRMIMRNCEKVPKNKILPKIAEIKDVIKVAHFRDGDGEQYWSDGALNALNSCDKNSSGIPLSKQKHLIKACIVKNRTGGDRFITDAANFVLDKVDRCHNSQVEALLSAVRTGVQYSEEVGDYIFSKEDAIEHYRNAKDALLNGYDFEWNLPVDYEK